MLGVFLDIETTGLDASCHAPIDIAFRILDLYTGQEKASFQSVLSLPKEIWEKRDLSSVQINGFTWEMVQTGLPKDQVRDQVIQIFKKAGIKRGEAVFICQNPSFDRGFFAQIVEVYTQEKLNWPYHWLDFASMYWALYCRQVEEGKRVFSEKINLSKNAIGSLYGVEPEGLPHRAFNGVEHLIRCYKAVVKFPGSKDAPEQVSG